MNAHEVVTLLNNLPSVADMKSHCSVRVWKFTQKRKIFNLLLIGQSEASLKEFLRLKSPTQFENQYEFLFWLLGVDRGRLIRLPFHKRLHVMNTRYQYIMTVICEPER